MQNSDIYRSENDFWKICIYRSIFDYHISVNISYSILTDICLHIPDEMPIGKTQPTLQKLKTLFYIHFKSCTNGPAMIVFQQIVCFR